MLTDNNKTPCAEKLHKYIPEKNIFIAIIFSRKGLFLL